MLRMVSEFMTLQGLFFSKSKSCQDFTNSVLYQFTKPGTYYVRCLEFCGYGHYVMITNFMVTNSTS